jgi:hypothetical protein
VRTASGDTPVPQAGQYRPPGGTGDPQAAQEITGTAYDRTANGSDRADHVADSGAKPRPLFEVTPSQAPPR